MADTPRTGEEAGSSRPLASYQPFDPAVQEDPWEYYRLLRAEGPVYRDPSTGMFMVARYATAQEVLRRWDVFSNRFGAAMGGGAAMPDVSGDPGDDAGYPPVDTMLTADPPEQKRFRSLVDKAFRLKRVRGLEERIRACCNELVDGFLAEGRVELREALAVPLPLTIIAEQLGVARDDLPRFKRWSDGFVAQLSGMASPEEQVEARRQIREFQRYFAAIVEARSARPRDDIISDMVNARIDGERPLDMPESLSILQQLLVAGNETTASAICEGARLLATHPRAFERLRADPGLIPNAVEEVLRLASPTSNMWRVALRDTELEGVSIPRGAMLMVRFAAANRDESVFPDPDRFEIERENAREHLAFGQGIHFCLGAQLARSELVLAFEVLCERLRRIRLDVSRPAPRHAPSILLRGLRALYIEFDAA